MRVPLIVRWPGRLAPRIEPQVVPLIGLAPTLMEFVGSARGADRFQAQSFAGLLRGDEDD